MKYKVIGWTYDTDRDYPYHAHLTPCVERAVIAELREKGYVFGGDAHEDHCPVLNDGTLVSYSWRGWGAVMAKARGEAHGDYDYMKYYMNALIPEDKIKLPPHEVDEKQIVPRQSLRDTFVMHLADEPYAQMEQEKKLVEFRLFDEKRRRIDIGDRIEFVRIGHEKERLFRDVAGFCVGEDFEDLFDCYLDGIGVLSEHPEACGCDRPITPKEFAKSMHAYYSPEKEKKYSVMAISVRPPMHTCKTYLRLCPYDMLFAEEFVQKFLPETDFPPKLNSFLVNEEYDVDVNVMIRKTIAPLLGREREVKELLDQSFGNLYLTIVPWIETKSDEPAPILSLDDDIIAFLYLSGIKMDLDYYVG